MRSDYDKEIQQSMMKDDGLVPLGKESRYSLPVTILTYISAFATFVVVLLILFLQTATYNVFTYY